MIRVINIDLFNTEVAVFAKDKDRRTFLRQQGLDPKKHTDACFSSAHMDLGPDGKAWFSMVIKPEATKATWVHECVHIADFLMDRLGIPTDVSNTEIRGYLVGHLFAGLEDIMGQSQ